MSFNHKHLVFLFVALLGCSSPAKNEATTAATGVTRATVRAYNTDDVGSIYLNGRLVAQAPKYQADTGVIDITSQLVPGPNVLELTETNTMGDYTWGFDVSVNGQPFFHVLCGAVSPYPSSTTDYAGCNDGDGTLGLVYYQKLTLEVP